MKVTQLLEAVEDFDEEPSTPNNTHIAQLKKKAVAFASWCRYQYKDLPPGELATVHIMGTSVPIPRKNTTLMRVARHWEAVAVNAVDPMVTVDDEHMLDMVMEYGDDLSPEYVKHISKLPMSAAEYAYSVMGCRWPAAEPAIATDGWSAANYAIQVLGKRFEAGEPAILTDAAAAARYARLIIQDIWPAADKIIFTKGYPALQYVVSVVRRPDNRLNKLLEGFFLATRYRAWCGDYSQWEDNCTPSEFNQTNGRMPEYASSIFDEHEWDA